MAKRKFKLSEQAINELQSAYHHSRQGQERTRFQAVRLYGEGYAVADIEKICGCAPSALMVWCRTYRNKGIAGLLDQRKGGNHAKLSAIQIEMIRELLHTYTPTQLFALDECVGDGATWTVPDLARLVEQHCGVVYQSDNSYRSLLRKCGFTRQRPGLLYKSRSERAVMDFEEELEKN
jgi:transposase